MLTVILLTAIVMPALFVGFIGQTMPLPQKVVRKAGPARRR